MHFTKRFPYALTVVPVLAAVGTLSTAQVVGETRIDASTIVGLDSGDAFGTSLTSLGDLDGDGIQDLAVGTPFDDGGGPDRGAVWILFMNADGSIKGTSRKINAVQGGFAGPLTDNDQFGTSVAAIGDQDGDSVVDLAVGAPKDDDGSTNRGAVWVLFLNTDGSVKGSQKISSLAGGFTGSLNSLDNFGSAVGLIGDLDADGRGELAVGVAQSDRAGQDTGSVWILSLNTDGSVKTQSEIASQTGGFSVALDSLDRFGSAVAGIDDLDSDGVQDLIVGADADDDGGNNTGALYVLFLNSDGTVKNHQKISMTAGDFDGPLGLGDRFGRSVAYIGDLEGDGSNEIIVGAPFADGSGVDRGEAWILSLDSLGRVRLERLLGENRGGVMGPLADADSFGSAVGGIGDLDGDGVLDIAIGAFRDDSAMGTDVGASWLAYLGDLPVVTNRNGSGINSQCLLPSNVPVLGGTWELVISTFSVPNATGSFVASFSDPLSGVFLNAGELLMDPFSNLIFVSNVASGPLLDLHNIPIADDLILLGRTFYAQGGIFAPGALTLCNGIEFTVGR